MPIIRHEHKKDYTVIANTALQDKQLSWKARGILAYLLSLPDNWEFNYSDLVNRAPDGRTSLQTGVEELKDYGYVTIKRHRDKNGKLGQSIWVVREKALNAEKPNVENPIQGDRQQVSTHSTKYTEPSKEGSDDLPLNQRMFAALGKTCSVDLSTLSGKQRGQLNQSEKILREAGARPSDVRAFREWWDDHHWIGQKGDAPRPAQVREEWGRYRDWAEQDDGWARVQV